MSRTINDLREKVRSFAHLLNQMIPPSQTLPDDEAETAQVAPIASGEQDSSSDQGGVGEEKGTLGSIRSSSSRAHTPRGDEDPVAHEAASEECAEFLAEDTPATETGVSSYSYFRSIAPLIALGNEDGQPIPPAFYPADRVEIIDDLIGLVDGDDGTHTPPATPYP